MNRSGSIGFADLSLCSFLRSSVFILVLAGLGSSACSERDPMVEARALQSEGRMAESLEPLRSLLVSDPDSAEVKFRYGLALSRTGNPGMAVWALRGAQEDPDWAMRAGLELARSALRSGNWANSIESATRVLETEPDNVDALSIRASSHIGALLEPELAVADLDRAIELEPGNILLRSSRVQALIMSGRIDEATEALAAIEPLFEAATGADRRALGPVCAMRAVFAKERGELEESETQLERCLEEFALDPVVLDTAIEFYDERREPERANELLKSAIEQEPTWLSFRSSLANRLRVMGKPEEAEALLRAGLAVDFPDMAGAVWTLLAQHFIELDDANRAVDAYAKAVELSRDVSEIGRLTYADMLVAAGRNEEALEIAAGLGNESYRKLVEARVNLAQGKPERALELFDEVLPLWPDNAGARYFTARAAEQVSDFNRAIAEYRQSMRSDPAAGDAGVRLAHLLLGLGDPQAAWVITTHHVQAQPQDRDGRLLLIAMALKRGGAVLRTQLEAVSATPFWPDAIALNLDWIAKRGGAEQAVERFDAFSNLDLTKPANAIVLRSLVRLLIASGKSEDAQSAVAAALEAHPEEAEFHSIAGLRRELISGDPSGGRADYERALELDPDEAHALEAMARIARIAGDVPTALVHFDRAALADPGRVEIQMQAARLAAESGGDTAGARQRWKAVHHEFPWEPEPLLQLSRIALARKDARSAVVFAEWAVRFGGGADAWEQLASSYEAGGETDRAREARERADQSRGLGASVAPS